MSANKLASSAQGLQSSAIRELLKHSKMAGVISLGGGIPNPDCSITKGLKLPQMPSYRSILARRFSMV
jgi:hypothetical protein